MVGGVEFTVETAVEREQVENVPANAPAGGKVAGSIVDEVARGDRFIADVRNIDRNAAVGPDERRSVEQPPVEVGGDIGQVDLAQVVRCVARREGDQQLAFDVDQANRIQGGITGQYRWVQ